MKMSKVFTLPAREHEGSLVEQDGFLIAENIGSKYSEHIAHAINCHDELVEALEGMCQLYPDDMSGTKGNQIRGFSKEAIFRINKARAVLDKVEWEV